VNKEEKGIEQKRTKTAYDEVGFAIVAKAVL